MATPPTPKHLVVLAHPDPESFCASVARCWVEEAQLHHQDCRTLDLYREGFDPVLKKEEQPGKPGYAPSLELLEFSQCLHGIDVLVLVYPIWFGTPPAMMKGFLERVVGSGMAFSGGAPQGKPPLANVHLVDISTSASSEPWLAEQGIQSSLQTVFDRYIAAVFGARGTDRLHLDNITTGMDQECGALKLAEVREHAKQTCAQAHARRWSDNANTNAKS